MPLTLELLTDEVDVLLAALQEYADRRRKKVPAADEADILILKLKHALATGRAGPSVPKLKV